MLERFDGYKPHPGPANGYGGERIAYIDKIKFIPIPEESVATMALLNKEIDFLQYVPFKNVEKFQKEYSKQGIVLDSIPGQSWYQIFFGLKARYQEAQISPGLRLRHRPGSGHRGGDSGVWGHESLLCPIDEQKPITPPSIRSGTPRT